MKKIYLGVIAVCLVLFTSCRFSENIYINEDGTGKFSFDMDGSQLMSMMGDEMAKSQDQKKIDSTISFKDLLKGQEDSIASLSKSEQEKLKLLEMFEMHMVMNAEEKKMRMNMFADFDNISEMQDMFKMINTAGEIDKSSNPNSKIGTNPMGALGDDNISKTKYSYTGNAFQREVVIVDKEKLATMQDSLGQAEMMFASSEYILNYHFPRKIKSVSLENAKINEDGKSFSVTVNFLEYIKNPTSLNLKVELEK